MVYFIYHIKALFRFGKESIMSEKRKDNKGRILRDGESQRNDGRYMFRYTDISGERKAEYSWRLVEKDPHPKGKRKDISLREKEEKIRTEAEDFISYTSGKMNLNDLFDMYYKSKIKLGHVKKRTYSNYKMLWDKHISKRRQVNIPINSLRKHHFITMYQDMQDDYVGNGNIILLGKVICAVLNYAASEDFIRKNYAKGCIKELGIRSNAREALTLEEQGVFLKYVASSSVYREYYWLFVFMIETACRASEICGLTWNDIKLNTKMIKIDHQLLHSYYEKEENHFFVDAPKTFKSNRYVPMSQRAIESIVNQKELMFRRGLIKNHTVGDYHDFVFLTSQGKLMSVNTIERLLKRIVCGYNKKEKYDSEREGRDPKLLPNITPHILRHTGCTRMAESGMDQRTLQEIMGHSNLHLTMQVYNHVDISRMRSEIEKVDHLYLQHSI